MVRVLVSRRRPLGPIASLDVNEPLTRWLMTPDDAPLLLEDFLHRPEWHQQAASRGVGVEAFVSGSKGRKFDRALCECCEVRVDCLEVALDRPDLMGIVGQHDRAEAPGDEAARAGGVAE